MCSNSGLMCSLVLCALKFYFYSMSGIDYLTNERGVKKAVVIDLRKHAQLWEDFHDTLVVRARKNEPRESLDFVRQRLKAKQAAHA